MQGTARTLDEVARGAAVELCMYIYLIYYDYGISAESRALRSPQ